MSHAALFDEETQLRFTDRTDECKRAFCEIAADLFESDLDYSSVHIVIGMVHALLGTAQAAEFKRRICLNAKQAEITRDNAAALAAFLRRHNAEIKAAETEQ